MYGTGCGGGAPGRWCDARRQSFHVWGCWNVVVRLGGPRCGFAQGEPGTGSVPYLPRRCRSLDHSHWPRGSVCESLAPCRVAGSAGASPHRGVCRLVLWHRGSSTDRGGLARLLWASCSASEWHASGHTGGRWGVRTTLGVDKGWSVAPVSRTGTAWSRAGPGVSPLFLGSLVLSRWRRVSLGGLCLSLGCRKEEVAGYWRHSRCWARCRPRSALAVTRGTWWALETWSDPGALPAGAAT